MPGGQGSPHVRTHIVDCVILALSMENGNQSIIDLEGPAFVFGNFAYPGNGRKF
jgi:hypothetical protein